MDISCLNPDRQALLDAVKLDKVIVKAKGAHVFDQAGNQYLDFSSQYGALPFGHNPDFVYDAIAQHGAQGAPALSQPLNNQVSLDLAARLVALTPSPLELVTFVTSGAEAVEAAFKLARAKTQKRKIISCVNGYHGKTKAALSATTSPGAKKYIFHDNENYLKVPVDDIAALKAALLNGDVAAFIVELVQAEGGVRLPSHTYLREAAALCKQHGVLFIVDEIQTGLGRLGSLFGLEQYPELEVDIMLISKALGGGVVPIGAMLCSKQAWCSEFGFAHSSTFANNGLTCAVAHAVLDHLLDRDRQIIAHVATLGNYLEGQLKRLVDTYPDVFRDCRGKGLLWGLELQDCHAEGSYFMLHSCDLGFMVPIICGYLMNKFNILSIPALSSHNVLRITPPLTVTQEQIDQLLHALHVVGQAMNEGAFGEIFHYILTEQSNELSRAFPANPNMAQYTPKPLTHRQSLKPKGKFAFFIHPPQIEDLWNSLPSSFEHFSQHETQNLYAWMDGLRPIFFEAGVSYYCPHIPCPDGGYVEGWLVSTALTPLQMMQLPHRDQQKLMDSYFSVAGRLGVDRIGLGAFTSIVTNGGATVTDNEFGLDVTSGNGLTAISAAEALIAASRGIKSSEETAAVIGAYGSIGRVAAIHLAKHFQAIILFGNPKNSRSMKALAKVAGEIYLDAYDTLITSSRSNEQSQGIAVQLSKLLQRGGEYKEALARAVGTARQADDYETLYERIVALFDASEITAPIMLALDTARYLPLASVILTATSRGKSFIKPACIRQNAVICDVARPSDLDLSAFSERPDVSLYEGGVLTMPDKSLRFGKTNILGFPNGVNLACLSETISLTMSGKKGHFSIGHNIDYDEALSIYKDATLNGFGLYLPESNTSPVAMQKA